jgi:hypothetical protein
MYMALQSAGLERVIEACRAATARGIYLGSFSDEA